MDRTICFCLFYPLAKNDHFHQGGKVGRSNASPINFFSVHFYDLRSFKFSNFVAIVIRGPCGSTQIQIQVPEKLLFLEETITATVSEFVYVILDLRHILQTFLGLISRLNFSGPYGMKNYTLSKTADVSLRL